jgi:hypothetical protein
MDPVDGLCSIERTMLAHTVYTKMHATVLPLCIPVAAVQPVMLRLHTVMMQLH